MELLIAFALAWVIRRPIDDTVDRFEDSNAAVRDRIHARYPNAPESRRARMVRNAARRNAAGFGAYQLRHGWPEFRYSVTEGWREARQSHQEWLENREPSTVQKKTGLRGWLARVREAARAGWDRAKEAAERRRAKKAEADKQPAVAPPIPAPPEKEDMKVAGQKSTPKSAPRGKESVNGSAVHNSDEYTIRSSRLGEAGYGGPSMAETGEVGGYESSKNFADNYANKLAEAESAREQYEAHLIANGGPSGDQAVMGTLTNAGDGLATARAGFQAHRAALETHQQGAEYAQSKGDAAASTEYLGAE